MSTLVTTKEGKEIKSIALLAEMNGVEFGNNYAKLPLGEFTLELTENWRLAENTFGKANDKGEKPKNFLVECTIKQDGSIVSSGDLRINSALKYCEIGKSYTVTTVEDYLDLDDQKKAYNKVRTVVQIAE